MKKITAVFLVFLILILNISAAYAQGEFTGGIMSTAVYLMKNVPAPSVSATGGEWSVIALARGGVGNIKYYDAYYAELCRYLKDKGGVLHSRKYTEYARVVLALNAIGKNPENVEGFNLVAPILDFEACVKQGINGAIWALIAIDSNNYGDEQIRGKYIEYILSKQKAGGGWSLSASEESAEADITAMALTALAKYRGRDDVSSSVKAGIQVLSKMQKSTGGYESSGVQNSESTAQVIVALSTLGISTADPRFIKENNSVIHALLSYRGADGGFKHTDSINIMATEQCLYALVAANRREKGKSVLFDMSDKNPVTSKHMVEYIKMQTEAYGRNFAL